jgi:hypothetical protein
MQASPAGQRMVSTNQAPYRISNSKRSGQSTGSLGFWADKFSITSLVLQSLVSLSFVFVSLCSNGSHFVGFIAGKHGPNYERLTAKSVQQ